MRVAYGKAIHRHFCTGERLTHGGAFCIFFGATRVSRAVSAERTRVIQAFCADAAVDVITAQDAEVSGLTAD